MWLALGRRMKQAGRGVSMPSLGLKKSCNSYLFLCASAITMLVAGTKLSTEQCTLRLTSPRSVNYIIIDASSYTSSHSKFGGCLLGSTS